MAAKWVTVGPRSKSSRPAQIHGRSIGGVAPRRVGWTCVTQRQDELIMTYERLTLSWPMKMAPRVAEERKHSN